MSNKHQGVTRRRVLQGGVGVGLVIGVSLWLARRGEAPAGAPGAMPAEAPTGRPLAPNAFVRIAADNTVTIIVKQHEMGQGITTGLATPLADELDADWGQLRYEYATANDELYRNRLLIGVQVTGGSASMADSYEQMRHAGAMARAMLVAAAAKAWGVAERDVVAEKGVLRAGSKQATYGAMANAAAEMAPPSEVVLKTPDRFTYIGKPVKRLDAVGKCTGAPIYTIDVRLPGMLTAVVAHPPVFGGQVKSFDASKALAVRGVRKVVQIPQGVAVIADSMWPAIKGRRVLDIVWDDAGAELRSSRELMADAKALLSQPGAVALSAGDVEAGLGKSRHTIDAMYEVPYLAHAPIEPMNSVVWMRDGKLETWSGHQGPGMDQRAMAATAGLKPEDVIVHVLPSGGSFGRRALPDYLIEAAALAKAAGLDVPIRVQWTRDDDMRAGQYRPMYAHHLKAAIDAKGEVCAWRHRISGQSVMGGDPNFAAAIVNGVDGSTIEGAANLPYALPNAHVDMHAVKSRIPVWWWRGVGQTHTVFAVESMVDELAHAARRDPLDFRLAMLNERPRHVAVLKRAAEKAGWGQPLPKGRARGIAVVHQSFDIHQPQYNSYAGIVAEVHLDDEGNVKVDRIVVAIDCGLVVNPDIVRAQMEGSVGFGLSAALYSELTFDKGTVQQSNYDDFRVARLSDMPVVDVHIIESQEKPTGAGEVAVSGVAPAVANAIAALTGQRIRTLPLAKTSLRRS